MRFLVQALATFALYFGGFNALVFWGWGYLTPAGVAAALAGAGCVVVGYFKFADKWDEIHRDTSEYDAPVIRTEGREATRLALSCEYHEPGEK